MITDNVWFWLALGLIPYIIECNMTPAPSTTLTIRALFWQFTVCWSCGQPTAWRLHIILIEWLGEARMKRISGVREANTKGDGSEQPE